MAGINLYSFFVEGIGVYAAESLPVGSDLRGGPVAYTPQIISASGYYRNPYWFEIINNHAPSI